ncbi:MAG: L-serine ammonia-lyase, iron-sulfur-dependent, subunit alpha [Bacteroidaceae bacterium]|nr:L-serine ammonia-lyase, iron-sulfur-dependent, subunit alpha [Bacteroidaceae bacterium]
MKTIKELYRIGTGPSSSHTMGPRFASERFLKKHPQCMHFQVTLYGSLASTGKGHLTDVAILDVLQRDGKRVDLFWKPGTYLSYHPNGMKFVAFDELENVKDEWTVFSVGGGALEEEGNDTLQSPDVYEQQSMTDILKWCRKNGRTLWEYVELNEGADIWKYLHDVWEAMKAAVERGLQAEGVLPGPLLLQRKAVQYYIKAAGYTASLHSRGLVFSYALAVSEENAAGGVIVTAPTCGSCGVVPGILYHLWKSRDFSEIRMLRALATAGLIGNVAKHTASISGAEAGCQAEVGVACAMAAAAANQLFGGSPAQIEYAAEMGLEHHLGMTCDPVCGMVQIPCIERNAYAAARAMDCNIYSTFSDGQHLVSYDKVLSVMMETGSDIPSIYRETSEGGLAKQYIRME